MMILQKLFWCFLLATFSQAWARSPRESLEEVRQNPHFIEIKQSDFLVIDLRYASKNNFMGRDLYGEFDKPFLHYLAYAKLQEAARRLRSRFPAYRLIILDSLRPRSVQRILYDRVRGTQYERYVAKPDLGSMHNYGFAIDLSVVDESGRELDMGTPFDSFSDLSQPKLERRFLKSGQLTATQVSNRKILRSAMLEAGFTQLPIEWWHFDALPAKEVKTKYKIFE